MWTWNCFCFDLHSCRTISGSQFLQNTWINIVAHWKFLRKYRSVSYLFSCNNWILMKSIIVTVILIIFNLVSLIHCLGFNILNFQKHTWRSCLIRFLAWSPILDGTWYSLARILLYVSFNVWVSKGGFPTNNVNKMQPMDQMSTS